MTIKDLLQQKRLGAVYVLARYFYKIGEPVLSDEDYDKIEKIVRENAYDTFKEYLERTYDDDPVPVRLLELLGKEPVFGIRHEERAGLYNYLNEDKSFSIRSVVSYAEAYPFFQRLRETRMDCMVSLKVDGVNTKMLYVDGHFALSLSRGRADGDSFDYTDNSAKVVPAVLKSGKKMMKVTGESFVTEEGLPVLRERYGKPSGYVSGKSSATSMLRVEHAFEDYKYLKTLIFSAEGLADTLGETFSLLEQSGFSTVPHKLVKWQDIPGAAKEFEEWAEIEIFSYFLKTGKGIPSDGIVAEVNDLNWTGTQHNQYLSRQLALKFGPWAYQVYRGVITGIRIEQRRVYKSVRIEIEPLVTADGNTAKIINSFNPSILIENDLYVGKTVYFERNSNAFNSVVYGSRLQQIAGSGDDRQCF